MNTEALNPPEAKTAAQRREDRQVVTPYAFGVADHLIGTRLASPARRAVAILIDLFCIAMLTTVSSIVLAGLVAWAFFRAGNRLKQKKRFNLARIALRFVAALMLFVFAMGVFDYAQNNMREDDDMVTVNTGLKGVNSGEVIGLTAKFLANTWKVNRRVKNGECEQKIDCWLPLANDLGQDLADIGLREKDAESVLSDVSEGISEYLNETELNQFHQSASASFEVRRNLNPISESADESTDVDEPLTEKRQADSEPLEPGLLDWVLGIADDFGIGFGWTAFYFSVFIAWWKGQTPGKKLLGIRVIKLDGSPLNLWESFERYSGYAAGLFTGLLGFLQIFWDANRQAIQDKIAETLVIQSNPNP